VTRIRLQYVKTFRDRHGTARHYFRRPGRTLVPLPGLPGSTGFMDAYAKALADSHHGVEIGERRTVAGSIDAMAIGYMASGAFQNLAPTSQQQYRRIFEGMRRDYGQLGIASLERRHVVLMIDQKAATPAAARDLLRCLRLLVAYAIKIGVRQDDPTAGVRVPVPRTDGFRTWTEDDIAAFEAAYPVGSKPRLALALLLGTALRCADVVRVGRGNVLNGAICGVVQQKTKGALRPIPIDDLAAAINAAAPSEHVVFLLNEHGRSFTAKSFGKWFTAQCERAGLTGLSPHGLRKAALRRRAENGWTANELAAFGGHKSLNEVARYTRAADQARLIRNAVERTERQRGMSNPIAGSGKPAEKGR
jgi:integrase